MHSFFFFKQKTAYEMRISDWSSDVCSSDLDGRPKYAHIRYQAHDESRCEEQHELTAPAWPTGCLLDPYRLPWRFLSGIAAEDPRTYDITYQQNNEIGRAHV